jgi:hypothetical protein
MSADSFSPALERILAHKAALPMRRVEVPEWGGADGPMRVYWTPWTAWEKRQVYGGAGARDDFQIECRILERKALGADGKRLFRDGDAMKLERGAHESVVAFVARVIANDRDADADSGDGDGDEGDAPERAAALMGTVPAVEAAAKN